MSARHRAIRAILFLTLSLACAPATVAPTAGVRAQTVRPPAPRAAGRYIVELRDDIVSAADVTETIAADDGVEITHVYDHAITGFAGQLTEHALAELEADPRVLEIVPDRQMYPFAQTIPAGTARVGATKNPVARIDGIDQRVDADIAILDMGVGPNADLNVVGGVDCTFRGYYTDNGGHGTHVAGIAAAMDNTSGMVGVAPGARIWSVKVLDAFAGNWSWVICGIDWVTAHADVIDVANMSIGEDLNPANAGYDGPMHRAIQRAVAAGVTFVVAAGNSHTNAGITIPAMYDEVITVSAIGDSDGKPGGLGPALSRAKDDGFASFSSYGAVVDIAAPGVDTLSTAMGGGLNYMSGTSFATPHVVGAAALFIAAHRGANGRGPGPAVVKAALLAAASPGPIPGDPDNYPEGILNVATLSGGLLQLSRTSGIPGVTVTLTMTGFEPSTTIAITWDSRSLTATTSDANGRAMVSIRIPNAVAGTHTFTASDGTSNPRSTFRVVPAVIAPASASVGAHISVSLRGFGRGESVALSWTNGSAQIPLGNGSVSTAGAATVLVTVPDSWGGPHTLTATGGAGRHATRTISIIPSVSANRVSAYPGGAIRLTVSGFKPRERVTFELQTDTGPLAIATLSITSTSSSRSLNTIIPAAAPPGVWRLIAKGSRGSTASVAFRVRPPATPTPAATASPENTASPEPSATPTVTATSSETATAAPTETETATSSPTDTATAVPAETATATPAATGTETATLEPTPTETATELPTPSPSPTETPLA